MPNPSYPKVISVMKRSGELGRRCRCRPVRYLNNIVEQDHRAIKRWVRASQGFRAFHSAWRTLQGIETMNMIRKGQVRWLAKDDVAGQIAFIEPCSVSTRPYNVHELRNTALLCSGLQHIPYDYVQSVAYHNSSLISRCLASVDQHAAVAITATLSKADNDVPVYQINRFAVIGKLTKTV